jgi:tetratricopeptide (TPR) repeat protein
VDCVDSGSRVAETCYVTLKDSRDMAVDHSTDLPESFDETAVRRLYTPAMLAELLGVPVAAIRRWSRLGVLRAAHCVRRLPYFDFAEVAVARRLAQLLQAGCSLRAIDRRLAELNKLMPDVERPLADPTVVVHGRQLFRRRGDDLAEPWGQLLLDFDSAAGEHHDHVRQIISFGSFIESRERTKPLQLREESESADALIAHLQDEAIAWEDEGELDRAAESYRTLLMAAGPRAEIQFALADVLYQAGDLTAARERYYAALELDEEYVEARSSLGCVLVETGELELAVATFEGALNCHPSFADAHFHLANALDRLGHEEEAASHYRTFLELAPESPWAAAARDRLSHAVALRPQS